MTLRDGNSEAVAWRSESAGGSADPMYERVKSAGRTPEPPKTKFYVVHVLQVTDPEGYTWGFLQLAPLCRGATAAVAYEVSA